MLMFCWKLCYHFMLVVLNRTWGFKIVTSPIPILVTGHILRCDVIINWIKRIQVVTTFWQLFTDNPTLHLSVRAFDSEGTFHYPNFSGTLCVCFAKWIFWRMRWLWLCSWPDPQEILLAVWLAWNLIGAWQRSLMQYMQWGKQGSLSEEKGRETGKRHHRTACLVFCDYRRFVHHHDAGYAPPPHILSLEDAGQWGESVLLYGIHSGSALIKVSFLHPEHKVWNYKQNNY